MKKVFLKGALIALTGVGLMAGSAMATPTPYATAAWTDYEYYQKTTEDPNGYIGQNMVEGNSYFFEFDLGAVNPNPLTNSALTLVDDVTGYGPSATPVKDIWASVSIFSVDQEVDGFTLDITAYFNNTSYVTSVWVDINQNNSTGTSTFKFSNQLLADWIADPSGNLLVSVSSNPYNPTAYNDFNLLEVGVGVAPVPEPATMLLMGTGLASLIAANRRRKAGKS